MGIHSEAFLVWVEVSFYFSDLFCSADIHFSRRHLQCKAVYWTLPVPPLSFYSISSFFSLSVLILWFDLLIICRLLFQVIVMSHWTCLESYRFDSLDKPYKRCTGVGSFAYLWLWLIFFCRIWQSQKIAELLLDLKVSSIISSPRSASIETAMAISKVSPCPGSSHQHIIVAMKKMPLP